MARLNSFRFIRTTRANLNAQASANALFAGEPYFITDENRHAIGTGSNTYQTFAKFEEITPGPKGDTGAAGVVDYEQVRTMVAAILAGNGSTPTPTPTPTPSTPSQFAPLVLAATTARTTNPLILNAQSGMTITSSTTAPTGKTLKALVPTANGAVDTSWLNFYANPLPYGGNGNYVQFATVTTPDSSSGNLSTGGAGAIAAKRGNLCAFEFMTSDPAPVLWLRIGGSPNRFVRFLVDGQYISKTATTFASGNNYVTLNLGSSAARRIRVEMQDDAALTGVYYSGSYTPAPATTGLRAAILMDSFGQTNPPGGTVWDGPMAVMAKYMGWTDVRSASIAGTGHVNPGPAWKFGDHLNDVTSVAPDVVVIGGPYNDNGSTYSGQVQANALANMRALRTALPNVPFLVLGSWAGSTGPSAAVIAVENSMKAAFDQFADPLSRYIPVSVRSGQNAMIYGTGSDATPNGTGNSDLYTNGAETPPTHPNVAGGAYLGKLLADAAFTALQGAAPTSRWTANGITFPIVPTGNALATSITLTRGGAASASAAGTNGRLVLNKDGFVTSPAIPFGFPTNTDATKSKAPAMFRASFKGVVPNPDGATPLVDIMDYNVGQFTLQATWSRTNLILAIGRGATSESIRSDDVDMKHGTNTLYEVEWKNNTSGTGGTATFYINGVQAGTAKTTTNKPFFSDAMVLNSNASIGNTGSSVVGLEVEYIEVSYLAS